MSSPSLIWIQDAVPVEGERKSEAIGASWVTDQRSSPVLGTLLTGPADALPRFLFLSVHPTTQREKSRVCVGAEPFSPNMPQI